MVTIDKILSIKTEEDFRKVALEVFRFQAENSPVYMRYLQLIDVNIDSVTTLEEIPFLPIELFKNHMVVTGFNPDDAEITFTSSGTTGSASSKHFVKDCSIYEKSFLKAFELFYDSAEECNIYALLPSYLERDGSSLIYMVDKLIERSYDGGFFLYNHDELLERIKNRDKTKKSILFGVSFALLDMAEKYSVDFNNEIIVMETGGMKGRRKELPRSELHSILSNALGVEKIASEYGMCECLSQSYSAGDGIFRSPAWMRIMIRDIHDPFKFIGDSKRGAVNIIDLANIYSCSFLQTRDIGISYTNGDFTIEGRLDNSDIRGCNLLI